MLKFLCYDGRLETNSLLDWIIERYKFFEYEITHENRKVKIAVTKLKGHALLWWDQLQTKKKQRGKENIKTWEKMIGNMKKRCLISYYQVNMLRRMHNLREKDMIVKEYTKEFYKLDIKFGHVDDEVEEVATYHNGLRISIQN